MKRFRYFPATLIISAICGVLFVSFFIFRNRPIVTIHEQQPKNQPMKIRGSIPYWDQDHAVASCQAHIDTFDSISLFWYFLTDNGEVAKYRDAKEDPLIIDNAHTNGIRVTAVITNLPEESGTTWDSERVASVLQDDQKRADHIEKLLAKLKALNFDGVTIDYEEVAGSERQNFSSFIAELSREAHSLNMYVGVALHPKRGTKADERYTFQDWSELAKHADELYIMAYGEHWDTGEAGPIASMPWVQKIVRFATKQRVPLNKFYLGIPLYGYDWNKDSDDDARGLTFTDVESLLTKYAITPLWDEKAQAPYFFYKDDGENHEVWFESTRSITQKISVAKDAGIGGITFWRLGGDDPNLWEHVNTVVK